MSLYTQRRDQWPPPSLPSPAASDGEKKPPGISAGGFIGLLLFDSAYQARLVACYPDHGDMRPEAVQLAQHAVPCRGSSYRRVKAIPASSLKNSAVSTANREA